MKKKGDYNLRRGKGIKWRMTTHRDIISGFTIDNLDTKTPDQASSPFEELFISIREVLENNASCCMDVEEERLTVCQALSEKIHKRFKDRE